MKRVLTAAVLIPIALAVLFLAPAWLFIACLGLIAILATREYLQIAKLHGCVVFDRAVLSLVAIGFAVGAWASSRTASDVPNGASVILFMFLLFLAPLFLSIVLLVASLRASEPAKALPGVALSYLSFFYISLPLVSLQALREISGHGDFLVMVMLVTVWVGDIAAFYIGSNLGRHKLAPVISPGKTWEGTAASLFAAAAVCWALLTWVGPRMPVFRGSSPGTLVEPPFWVALGIGAAINVAAQLGDLVESMMKRGAGIKDSGSLLPGHGGALDRIDAMLFAAPVAMLLFMLARDTFLQY